MWLVIAGVCGLDILWMAAAGITMKISSILIVALGSAFLGAIAYLYAKRDPRIAETANMGAKTVLFSAAAATLSYLVLTLDAPLADARLVAIDRAMGFDWLAWFHWVHAHPTVHSVLNFAYDAIGPEIIVALLWLSLTGKHAIVREFQWATILALFAIIPISGMVPALGGWDYFGTGLSGGWIPDLLALRAHEMPVFDCRRMTGIITCPSFHTSLGIIFIAIARFDRRLLLGSILLNGAMIASVPSEGSHYLFDALSGAGVAVAALIAAQRIEAGRFWPALQSAAVPSSPPIRTGR